MAYTRNGNDFFTLMFAIIWDSAAHTVIQLRANSKKTDIGVTYKLFTISVVLCLVAKYTEFNPNFGLLASCKYSDGY